MSARPDQDQDQDPAVSGASSSEAALGDPTSDGRPRRDRGGRATLLAVLAVVAVLLVALPTGLAYQVSQDRDPVYGARSELVFLGASTQSPDRAEQQLRTQTVLLSSRAFLSPAATQFDVPLEELQEAVEVEQLRDSEVIQLTVTADDPDQARRLTAAIVDTYVSNIGVQETTEAEQELLSARLAELQEELTAVEARLAELSAERAQRRAAELPDPITPEQLRLENQARSLTDQVSDLQGDLTELRITDLQEQPAVSVLTPAYELDEPLAPRPLQAAAAGLLVGLLLATAFVVVGLRLRRSR